MASDRWTDKRARIECSRRHWAMVEANTKGVWDPQSKRWIPVSADVLGILDGLATTEQGGVIGLQWTSRSNVSARLRKIRASEHLAWLELAGFAVVVWGFDPDCDQVREEVLLAGRALSAEPLLRVP